MASPPRSSKFIEGPLSTTPNETANEFLDNILSEMDEFESKRKNSQHRSSHSSSDSLPSSSATASPTNTSHPQYPHYPAHTPQSPLKHVEASDRFGTVREGRRSINFTRRSLDQELESGGKRRESGSGSGSGSNAADAGEKTARKFVGRLRALTGGRSRDVKPYSGT